MNNNLFKYFKREASLPSPSGPLSQKMPSSMIQAANDSVSSVVSTAGDGSDGKKRGPYVKLSSEDKARPDCKLRCNSWNFCSNKTFSN